MAVSAAEIAAEIIENQGKMFSILNKHVPPGETEIFFVCPVGFCPARTLNVQGDFRHDVAGAYARVPEAKRPHCDHGAMLVPRFAQP